MSRLGKINWKRLKWAIKEEACIALVVIIIIAFLTIPWVLILTGSRWWILLYPAAFFVGGVWEKYNGN